VSGHQLQGALVVDDVRNALEESGLDARCLVLEITESVLMQESDVVIERMHQLKQLGVRLAIDDFGTGYSSLGYLQRFPVDILKIDKAFIEDVGRNGTDPALARAIIALSDALSLQTIAEGIELGEQLTGLRELGCGMGQGYFLAKPQTPSAIEALLDQKLEGVQPAQESSNGAHPSGAGRSKVGA
jgi:EAL domain-containing protein (putative c-di-GMP-specific phosphodiesterase class I)